MDDDKVTEIAHYLFDDRDGKDPYIEDNATLWILHYLLVGDGGFKHISLGLC